MYSNDLIIPTLSKLQGGSLPYVLYSIPSTGVIIQTGRIPGGAIGYPIALGAEIRRLVGVPYMALLSLRFIAKFYSAGRLSSA